MSRFIQQVIDAVNEMHAQKSSQKLYMLKYEVNSEGDILSLLNMSVENQNDPEALFYLLCALDDILSNSIYTKRFCLQFKSFLNQYIQHILQRTNVQSQYEIYCQKEYSKVITTIASKSLSEEESKQLCAVLLKNIQVQYSCQFLLHLLDRFIIQCIQKFKYHSFDNIIYDIMTTALQIIFTQQKHLNIQILKNYYSLLYTCIRSYGISYNEQKILKCIISKEQLDYLVNFFLQNNQAMLKLLFNHDDPQIFPLNQELLQLICSITRLTYINNDINVQSFILALLQEITRSVATYEIMLPQDNNTQYDHRPSGLLNTLIQNIGTQSFIKTITELTNLQFGVTFDLEQILTQLRQIIDRQITASQYKIQYEDHTTINILQFIESLISSYYYLLVQQRLPLESFYSKIINIVIDILPKITFNNFMCRTFHSLFSIFCGLLVEHNHQQYKMILDELYANYCKQQLYQDKVLFFINFSNENIVKTWMFDELISLIDVQLQQSISVTQPSDLQIQFQTNEFLVSSLWELSMNEYICILGDLNIKTQRILLLYLIKLLQFNGAINSLAYKHYNSYNPFYDKVLYIQCMDFNKIAQHYGPINNSNILTFVKILKEKIQSIDPQLMYEFGQQLYQCGLYPYVHPEVIKFIVRYEVAHKVELINPGNVNIRIITQQYKEELPGADEAAMKISENQQMQSITELMQIVNIPMILNDLNLLKDLTQDKMGKVQKNLVRKYIEYILEQLQKNAISKEDLNAFLELFSELVKKYVMYQSSPFYSYSDELAIDSYYFISFIQLISCIQQILTGLVSINKQYNEKVQRPEMGLQFIISPQYDTLQDGLFQIIVQFSDDLYSIQSDYSNLLEHSDQEEQRKQLQIQLLLHGIVPLMLNQITINTISQKILTNNQFQSNQAKQMVIQICYLIFGQYRQNGFLNKYMAFPLHFFDVLNSDENTNIDIYNLRFNIQQDDAAVIQIEQYFNQMIIHLIAWMFNVYSDYNSSSELYITAIIEICCTIQEIQHNPMSHYYLIVSGYKYYYQQIYGIDLQENYLLNQIEMHLQQNNLNNYLQSQNEQLLDELHANINKKNQIHQNLLESIKFLFTFVPQ